ncbi:unnamed protein product, partial [Amoebophrya sp. A25]|eukprot:GSA25T00026616001.1
MKMGDDSNPHMPEEEAPASVPDAPKRKSAFALQKERAEAKAKARIAEKRKAAGGQWDSTVIVSPLEVTPKNDSAISPLIDTTIHMPSGDGANADGTNNLQQAVVTDGNTTNDIAGEVKRKLSGSAMKLRDLIKKHTVTKKASILATVGIKLPEEAQLEDAKLAVEEAHRELKRSPSPSHTDAGRKSQFIQARREDFASRSGMKNGNEQATLVLLQQQGGPRTSKGWSRAASKSKGGSPGSADEEGKQVYFGPDTVLDAGPGGNSHARGADELEVDPEALKEYDYRTIKKAKRQDVPPYWIKHQHKVEEELELEAEREKEREAAKAKAGFAARHGRKGPPVTTVRDVRGAKRRILGQEEEQDHHHAQESKRRAVYCCECFPGLFRDDCDMLLLGCHPMDCCVPVDEEEEQTQKFAQKKQTNIEGEGEAANPEIEGGEDVEVGAGEVAKLREEIVGKHRPPKRGIVGRCCHCLAESATTVCLHLPYLCAKGACKACVKCGEGLCQVCVPCSLKCLPGPRCACDCVVRCHPHTSSLCA